MSKIEKWITDDDKRLIEDAVRRAEKRTSGEIVPYFVESSDDYEEAAWKGGYFLGTAVFGLIIALDMASLLPFKIGSLELGISFFGSAFVGFGLTLVIPFLKRIFAGEALIQRRVEQRATTAFLQEELFLTRDRTGILIFISLFEKRVQVIGDRGINEKVSHEDWVHVVDAVIRGIKERRTSDGIVKAIDLCGELLEKAGVAIRNDDQNELSNRLRTDG
jgi:putative membrane protein